MISNSLMIAIAEAKDAVQRATQKDPQLDLRERLRAAFGATRNHWLVTDEDMRFRAGVGGVLTATEDEGEKARITAELQTLRVLGAAMSGVPVDFEAAFASDGPEPIGMMAIWRELR